MDTMLMGVVWYNRDGEGEDLQGSFCFYESIHVYVCVNGLGVHALVRSFFSCSPSAVQIK